MLRFLARGEHDVREGKPVSDSEADRHFRAKLEALDLATERLEAPGRSAGDGQAAREGPRRFPGATNNRSTSRTRSSAML